ncbi:MAG: RNA-binding S4 domain-containing protein [Ruminiclostridium sp.]|nr:RNA-binding S4 domain-containing protein [Ruminiclostridium sp.]MBQ8841190.1 RNA-binding S4 domain-containing protein [Ruminiclostridium sp.]
MEKINVAPPFIKLEQFLKFANIAETGGMAKLMINDGIVTVNGEVCMMRGKKLYNNDVVAVNFEEETEEFLCVIEE